MVYCRVEWEVFSRGGRLNHACGRYRKIWATIWLKDSNHADDDHPQSDVLHTTFHVAHALDATD